MSYAGDDLTIVIPLYKRIGNMWRVQRSILEVTPDAEVLFVASMGDDNVCAVLIDTGWPCLTIPGDGGERGDYARKINWAYRATDRPFIFTGADDLFFHPGWYAAARSLMVGPIGVVGTVDKVNGRTMNGTHSTHSLVARWYADRGGSVDEPGMIYHEGYYHEFCDDELVRTAMARGAYAHAYDAVVEHRHMLADHTLDDETYRHGRKYTRRSKLLFRQRRALWGDTRGGGLRNYPAARPTITRR